MKIACIGWGSLIWRSGNLKAQRHWFEDGPLLPIEFTRISDNGLVTLVIDNESKHVRTLWTLMNVDNIKEARISLMKREGTKDIENIRVIGKHDKPNRSNIEKTIHTWLKRHDLDYVIWTGLSYKTAKNNRERPSINDVVEHLFKLLRDKRMKVKRVKAEEYVRRAPKQIDTEYRRIIEKKFGWAPV